jgi:hypothetical protein
MGLQNVTRLQSHILKLDPGSQLETNEQLSTSGSPISSAPVGLSRLVSSLGFQYLDLFRDANQDDATVFRADCMLAMRRRVQVVACMQILFSE